MWQHIKQIADRPAAAADRQPFEHFRCKHESGDDQSREKFPDCGSGEQRDGHGQFHRHPAGEEVGDRLLEDRPSARQRRREGDHVEAGGGSPQPQGTGQGLPQAKPTGDDGHRHEADPHQIDPPQEMLVIVFALFALSPPMCTTCV